MLVKMVVALSWVNVCAAWTTHAGCRAVSLLDRRHYALAPPTATVHRRAGGGSARCFTGAQSCTSHSPCSPPACAGASGLMGARQATLMDRSASACSHSWKSAPARASQRPPACGYGQAAAIARTLSTWRRQQGRCSLPGTHSFDVLIGSRFMFALLELTA